MALLLLRKRGEAENKLRYYTRLVEKGQREGPLDEMLCSLEEAVCMS